MGLFLSMEDLKKLYKKNLAETKKKVRESVAADLLIIQASNNIGEIDRVINVLGKRLREWYELYLPEFSKTVHSHEAFVDLILKFDKKTLLKKLNLGENETMGADLSKEDLKPILDLAKEIDNLYKLRLNQEKYLEKLMEKACPTLLETAGVTIGAKLITLAGSLKHLAELPSSTIQVLGAEKALFRHLRNKKFRCPKYGVLHEHQSVQKAKKDEKGKAARQLASKISIAVKVDYFRK